MIVNMLKAISQMLVVNNAPPEVKCARIMLEEIIKGMVRENKPTLEALPIAPMTTVRGTSDVTPAPPTVKPKPKPKPKEEHKGPLITVDKDHKLLPIKGFPMDAKLKIDGKIMTHKEAIGQTFTKIERID